MKSDVLAVVLSGVACVLAGVSLTRGAKIEPRAASDPAGLQEIEGEVERLRNEVEHLASPAPAPALADGRHPVDGSVESPRIPQEILDRLAALEKSIAVLQKASTERTARSEPPRVDVAESLKVATDPSTDAAHKLAALKALRGQTVDGKDARTHDVVLSMIDLADRSQDEGTREDVYRNLHGVHDSDLRDAMLRALSNDPSARVRSKVAEDINTFLPDPAVESALRQAADSDPDDGVRAAALRTLSGRR